MRGCAAQPRAGFVGERARGIGLTLDAYQAASVEEPEDASQAPEDGRNAYRSGTPFRFAA